VDASQAAALEADVAARLATAAFSTPEGLQHRQQHARSVRSRYDEHARSVRSRDGEHARSVAAGMVSMHAACAAGMVSMHAACAAAGMVSMRA